MNAWRDLLNRDESRYELERIAVSPRHFTGRDEMLEVYDAVMRPHCYNLSSAVNISQHELDRLVAIVLTLHVTYLEAQKGRFNVVRRVATGWRP